MPDIFHGKIYINSIMAGSSEGHYLAASSLDHAQLLMTDYCSLRAAMLSPSCTIIAGSVSTVETIANSSLRRAPDGLPVRNLPSKGEFKTAGTDQENTINIMADALQVKFRSSFGGRNGNKMFRGVPDFIIRDERFNGLVGGLRIKTEDVPASPVPPLWPNVYSEALLNVIKWLLKNSLHGYNATKGSKHTLTTAPWESAVIIRPTKRNVGRPWGPFRGRRKRTMEP